MQLNKVLLIHTDGNTFNNPTLKCLVDLLLEKNVEITISYPRTIAPMPEMKGLVLLPFGKWHRKVKNFLFNAVCLEWASRIAVLFENLFIYKKYDLVIAVDRRGLIEAHHLLKITGTPFVFFSFEIMFASETSSRYKRAERVAGKNARYWFVQDKVRAKILEHENALNPQNRVLIPLASSGLPLAAKYRLRDTLGIPPDKKVAIAIGSIRKWSMIYDVVSTVNSWPDNWVLIIHDRYGNTHAELNNLGCDLTKTPRGKIYISNKASDLVDDMSEVLAGVNLGLAFYNPDFTSPYTGNNLKFLGISSGKISTFLRHDIPVILNEIGEYSELAKKHQFGIVISDISEISTKLRQINSDGTEFYPQQFFSDFLDFNNYKKETWEHLISAIEKP